MGDRTTTTVVERGGNNEDAVFREMIEAEEELLERRREVVEGEADGGITEHVPTLGADSQSVTGTVRAVTREGGDAVVEFFPGDGVETETDRVPWPDDPTDTEEPLVRLFDLCGVPRGRVTELQGERVPLVQDKDGSLAIHAPESTTRPALGVYRAWWWLRRHGVDPNDREVRLAAKFLGGGTTVAAGNYVTLLFLSHAANGPLEFMVYHFPELASFAEFPPAAVMFALVGLAMGVVAVAAPLVTLGVLLYAAYRAILRGWTSVKAHWPF